MQIRHPQRIFTIGRLDRDSTGLLLLTNDGGIVNAVLGAASRHAKVYEVTVNRVLRRGDVATLARGVIITTVAQRDVASRRKARTAPTRPCKVVQVLFPGQEAAAFSWLFRIAA